MPTSDRAQRHGHEYVAMAPMGLRRGGIFYPALVMRWIFPAIGLRDCLDS
jgi:hypothetical protein